MRILSAFPVFLTLRKSLPLLLDPSRDSKHQNCVWERHSRSQRSVAARQPRKPRHRNYRSAFPYPVNPSASRGSARPPFRAAASARSTNRRRQHNGRDGAALIRYRPSVDVSLVTFSLLCWLDAIRLGGRLRISPLSD